MVMDVVVDVETEVEYSVCQDSPQECQCQFGESIFCQLMELVGSDQGQAGRNELLLSFGDCGELVTGDDSSLNQFSACTLGASLDDFLDSQSRRGFLGFNCAAEHQTQVARSIGGQSAGKHSSGNHV